MKINTVDLYSEHRLNKDDSLDGRLTCMLLDDAVSNHPERPCILIVAGGGYEHVSKREQEPVATKYLAQGYHCFILHYSTKVLYPTALIEGALAMNYIRSHSDELGVDASRVYAMGFSAGAHLVGCLALNYDEKVFLKAVKNLGCFENADLKKIMQPDAVLLCYPVITAEKNHCHQGSFDMLTNGDNRLISALSLEKRIKSDMPKTFMWHTATDGSVPVYNSLCFALALSSMQIPFELHIFERGKHGLSVADTEVYNSDEMPEFSIGIKEWVKLSLNWLKGE